MTKPILTLDETKTAIIAVLRSKVVKPIFATTGIEVGELAEFSKRGIHVVDLSLPSPREQVEIVADVLRDPKAAIFCYPKGREQSDDFDPLNTPAISGRVIWLKTIAE